MRGVTRLLLAALVGGIAAAQSPAPAPVPAPTQAADGPFMPDPGGRTAAWSPTDGKVLYEHVCQACHMADAKGAASGPGSYPALAGNPKLGTREYPVLVVVNGQGAMPAFGTVLRDEQVAAIVNYVRSNFGNGWRDALAATDVRALRPASRQAPVELRGR